MVAIVVSKVEGLQELVNGLKALEGKVILLDKDKAEFDSALKRADSTLKLKEESSPILMIQSLVGMRSALMDQMGKTQDEQVKKSFAELDAEVTRLKDTLFKQHHKSERDRAMMQTMSEMQPGVSFDKAKAEEYLQGTHTFKTASGFEVTQTKGEIHLESSGIFSQAANYFFFHGNVLNTEAGRNEFVKLCEAKFDKNEPVTIEGLDEYKGMSTFKIMAKGGIFGAGGLLDHQNKCQLALDLAEKGFKITPDNLKGLASNPHFAKRYERHVKEYEDREKRDEAAQKFIDTKGGVFSATAQQSEPTAKITAATTPPSGKSGKTSGESPASSGTAGDPPATPPSGLKH